MKKKQGKGEAREILREKEEEDEDESNIQMITMTTKPEGLDTPFKALTHFGNEFNLFNLAVGLVQQRLRPCEKVNQSLHANLKGRPHSGTCDSSK